MFYKNSKINTENIAINGNQIQYNFEQEIINYWSGGSVISNNNNISSDELTYHIQDNQFIFSRNIRLLNEDFTIKTEHMTNKDSLINFLGPTRINYENILIECQKGNLTNSQNMEIFDGLTITSDTTIIKANYLKEMKREIISKTIYLLQSIIIHISMAID